MKNVLDVGIVGSGVAGTFALQRLLKTVPGIKVGIFDAGRPGGKRRHQTFGFLGCLPGSDGKFYFNDLKHVSHVSGIKKTMSSHDWVMSQLGRVADVKLIKDTRPSLNMEKRLNKHGFEVELNNYYQLYPKDIHSFSRVVYADIDTNQETVCSFDNEVFKVLKHKNYFIIATSGGDYKCKKVLISVGRGGWRWASELFNNFGIVEQNDVAKFGIRVEVSASCMKEFNQSNCSLIHNMVDIGPMCNYGTIIPEDNLEMAITAFRANESRWESDKVSFDIIAEKHFPGNGFEQVDRLGKLTFIIANDRIMKEKLSMLVRQKSRLSIIPEYVWLREELQELNEVIPGLIDKGYFYAPTIKPFAPQIKLDKHFESVVSGMYVAGESANVPGLLGAAVSGTIAADAMSK